MLEGLTEINAKFSNLTNRLNEEVSQKFPSESFLAELIERLRNLENQMGGLILGQLPAQNLNLLSFNLPPNHLRSVPEFQKISATAPFVSHPEIYGEVFGQNEFLSKIGSNIFHHEQLPISGFPNLEKVSAPSIESNSSVFQLIIQFAQRYSVDPALALAIAKAESDFNPNAISHKGAVGIMQLMPETAKALGVENPFDPAQNIDGGIRYLKGLIDRFGGNIALAVAAYNAGPNTVRRYGGIPPFPETQNFVRRVFNYMENFQKEMSMELQSNSIYDRRKGAANLTGNKLPKNVKYDEIQQSKSVQYLQSESFVGEETERVFGNGANLRHDANSQISNSMVKTNGANLGEAFSHDFNSSARQSVVHRLTIELPITEDGERIRLQVSLPVKASNLPTVQISLKLSDEQLASQLTQNLPNLRHQLLGQGINLAQWTIFPDWWEGRHRDPAEYFGDWRRLPSASHDRLPANFLPDEGTWA